MDSLFSILGHRADGDHASVANAPSWDAVQERLEDERHRSLEWLRHALERSATG
jgi:hypothetical protein